MKKLLETGYPSGNGYCLQNSKTESSFSKPTTTRFPGKSVMLVLLILIMQLVSQAQEARPMPVKKYMQVTTVESVLAGGLGRSKMIITEADGSQTETELENLFSIVGINFKNIKQNEEKLLKTLKEYTGNGWKLEQATSLTLSQNDNGAGGIFMTRYLLAIAE